MPQFQRLLVYNSEQICTYQDTIQYVAWQHKEISMSKTIIPTAGSFLLLILLGILTYCLYKRYNRQE
jgi:hypothetical protein